MTTSIPMSVADVSLLASAYPDQDEWRAKIYYDGTSLIVPDNLSDKVSSVDLVAARKNNLLAYAASKRYAVEVGGIAVSGVPISTDDRSKQMIMGARIAADSDSSFTTDWVGDDGNIYPLVAAQVIGISNAVLAHVQTCFATFATVRAAITAGTITTNAQVDTAFAAI